MVSSPYYSGSSRVKLLKFSLVLWHIILVTFLVSTARVSSQFHPKQLELSSGVHFRSSPVTHEVSFAYKEMIRLFSYRVCFPSEFLSLQRISFSSLAGQSHLRISNTLNLEVHSQLIVLSALPFIIRVGYTLTCSFPLVSFRS